MAPVAMAFGVLELYDSPPLVGLVLGSQTAAQMVFQLYGGALADRWSRQRQLVFADVLAASAQALLAFLLLATVPRAEWLMALMAVNGAAMALHLPAMVGIVPQVVAAEELQPANAFFSLSRSGARAPSAEGNRNSARPTA